MGTAWRVHECVRFAAFVAGHDEQLDGDRFDDVLADVGGHDAAQVRLRAGSILNTGNTQQSRTIFQTY